MSTEMPNEALPKRAWGPGPWQDEPDSARWTHAGLECYVYRNLHVTGSLNGYVAVTDEHPWWGKEYNECVAMPQCDPEPEIDYATMERQGFPVPAQGSRMRGLMSDPRWSCDHRIETMLEVHGGVTYAGPMVMIADEQEDRFAWGFGFDTGHAGDVTPAMDALLRQIYLSKPGGAKEWAEHQRVMTHGFMANTYKDLAYVQAETERLAEQLAIVKGTGWQGLREPRRDSDGDDRSAGAGPRHALAWRL